MKNRYTQGSTNEIFYDRNLGVYEEEIVPVKIASLAEYVCSEMAKTSTGSTKKERMCSERAELSTGSTKAANLCSERAIMSTGGTKTTDACSKGAKTSTGEIE